jgi:gliding motility-associated-like protein
MLDNKHFLLLLFLVFCCLKTNAQANLVPNGDFEDVKICPSGQSNFYNAKGWFTPQIAPITLNDPCQYGIYWAPNTDTFGVNKTRSSSFETYGFFVNVQNLSHHRVYLATQLKEKLVAGQRYYFEMSFRTLDSVAHLHRVITDFSDGQAVAFSSDFPTYDWNVPNDFMHLKPILSHSLVKDYNWHKLKGCFTAVGNEKYIIIGNFRSNSETVRAPTARPNSTYFANSTHVLDNVVLVPVKVSLPDTAVCQGQSVTLNVGNTLIDSMRYLWQDGTTTPQYVATKSAHLQVKVIYPTDNCVAQGGANITVLDANYKSSAVDSIICQNGKTTFTAGTGYQNESITWQNGDKMRTFTANTEGVYFAKVANTCARWTDTFRLRFQNCDFEAYIPTAFSPNGDNINDDFRPFIKTDFIKIENYDFRIFNRWGSLIFASQNPQTAWDGTFHGQPCDMGVYIWTLKVPILHNGRMQTKELSGDVSIIR